MSSRRGSPPSATLFDWPRKIAERDALVDRMGAADLCTYKYIVTGNGQIRA